MEFGSQKLKLAAGQVDLWFAFTDCPNSESYQSVLGEDEISHLQELQLPEHRQEYLVSRALLRDSLSRYASVKPEDWQFVSNRFGKPELADKYGAYGLHFNVAHTHGLTVCAITVDADIGVDVEHHADNMGLLDVADDYFSGLEVKELRSHPQDQQSARFFLYWTLKESYIKAKGEGLSIPLDSFSFQVTEDTVRFLPPSEDISTVNEQWFFRLFQLSDSYTSALAVNSPVQQLRLFEATPYQEYRQLQDASELFREPELDGAYKVGIC